MRSQLIYHALKTLPNRYLLCQAAAKATRRFHRTSTRMEETTNQVLGRIAAANGNGVLAAAQIAVAESQRQAA